MISGIHHIELNVSDLEKSFAFYSLLARFFEGSNIEKFGGSFSWEVGPFYFYFNQVQPRFAEGSYHRKRTGLDHIAINIGSKNNVLKLNQFLSDNSIPLLYRAENYGPSYFALFIEDPDRIKLEFGANTTIE